MPYPAMPTPVQCAKCGTRFVAQVRNIIDVGDEPNLKEDLLRGRLNVARCPQCGAEGLLSTPLVYHDPDKELLITYVPPEVGLAADQREQYVGSLVNAVMEGTPQEKRKGYFFQPKTALTMESLYEMILEADGISREVLQAQRERIRLLERLLAAIDDEPTFNSLVEENKDKIDYETLLLLSSMIEQETIEGNTEGDTGVEGLVRLRERLQERISPSKAPQGMTYDDLIALLCQAQPGDEFQSAVAANRLRMDYGFFQALTAKIEEAERAGNSEEAQTLTALRQRINEELDAQDDILRAAEDRAILLLMDLLEAQDIEGTLRTRQDEVDEIFLAVLTRYIAAAQQRQDEKRVAKLRAILNAAVDVIEESMPPDLRLVNKLARTETIEECNALLEENRALLTDDFLRLYDRSVQALAARDKELAEHLDKVRAQIVAKMTIQRA